MFKIQIFKKILKFKSDKLYMWYEIWADVIICFKIEISTQCRQYTLKCYFWLQNKTKGMLEYLVACKSVPDEKFTILWCTDHLSDINDRDEVFKYQLENQIQILSSY